MGRNDEAWAVFWCSLLSPLLLGEIPEAEREAYFRTLAEDERLFPDGQHRRVSVRTLRRWWRRLRDEGTRGVHRRRRSDLGTPRKKDQPLLERAVELKKEQPRRSDVVINRILRQEFGRDLPRSTLYRHLHREGATRRKLGVAPQKVRCRWTRDHSNSLWVGDFEHGPPVMHEGRSVTTRLSAWIDCHSRYVVEARYYLAENFDVLVDSLLRAWAHHGASREIYVDNAKIYHANALKLACTELNIKLLHRPPREPEPGGLIERLFQTLQGQLEAEIRAARLLSLSDINRALFAWLGQEYHENVHSETHQTPRERFEGATRFSRTVRLNSVIEMFHRREKRTVHRDFSDVQIDGAYFAVDPKLRGDRVEVRYDPFQRDDEEREVQIYALDGRHLGIGRLYQRQKGYHSQPEPTVDPAPIEPRYLDALEAAQAASHEQERCDGLDFQSASRRNVWSFPSFATLMAKLMGRDGISAFSGDELTALHVFHTRHDRVHESLVKQAVASVESLTVPQILFQLQSLLSQGDL